MQDVAGHFGLATDLGIYGETPRVDAIDTIEMLLHVSLAYSVVTMEMSEAKRVAREFLSPCEPSCKFFTNVGIPFRRVVQGGGKQLDGFSYNPATDSTFDAGLLIVGTELHACLWFEDED